MKLYDKLPVDTRDAILTEAAALSTMLEGMDHSAAKLRAKAARLRSAAHKENQSKSSNTAVKG